MVLMLEFPMSDWRPSREQRQVMTKCKLPPDVGIDVMTLQRQQCYCPSGEGSEWAVDGVCATRRMWMVCNNVSVTLAGQQPRAMCGGCNIHRMFCHDRRQRVIENDRLFDVGLPHSYNTVAIRRPICTRFGPEPEPTGSGPIPIQY